MFILKNGNNEITDDVMMPMHMRQINMHAPWKSENICRRSMAVHLHTQQQPQP